MARTLTGNNKRREQMIQSRILDRLVLKYRVRIRNEIRRAMRAAATSLGDEASLGTVSSQVWAEHRSRIDNIMKLLWRDSGHTMAEHIDPTKKSSTWRLVKREEPDLVVPPTEQADLVMQRWISDFGGDLIVEISETTKRNVRKAVEDGIANGMGEKEIAKQIRALAPSIADSRSQTIARTETHGAANLAAQATAKATGLQLMREWSASRGNRTRDTHRDADGQVVGIDELFSVGNAKLRFPGDSRAGHPEETINCRCAVLYVLR